MAENFRGNSCGRPMETGVYHPWYSASWVIKPWGARNPCGFFKGLRILTLMRTPLKTLLRQGDLHFVPFRVLTGGGGGQFWETVELAALLSKKFRSVAFPSPPPKAFLLAGFVVMPEHVQLLCASHPESSPSMPLAGA